jgi:hypothetical protein
MPFVPLPEIRLPSPATPPIRFPLAPDAITPLPEFGSATSPDASVPMKFPPTALSVAPPMRSTPLAVFPEMRFPSPIWLNEAPETSTPSEPLPRSRIPPTSVPMRLPLTCVELAAPAIVTPLPPFPEMTWIEVVV